MLLLETCTFLCEITSGCNSRVALRNAHRLLRRSQQNPRSCLQSCCVKVVRSAGQAGLPVLAPSVCSPGELLSSPLTFFFHPKPGSKPILPPPLPQASAWPVEVITGPEFSLPAPSPATRGALWLCTASAFSTEQPPALVLVPLLVSNGHV